MLRVNLRAQLFVGVVLVFFSLFMSAASVRAAAALQTPQQLEARWADISYVLPMLQQESAFAELARASGAALKATPNSAELLGWHGIILSSWAGVKGGHEALDLVKQARDLLEQAVQINSRALDGAALANLACLYYMVPGWPLGFGDKKKAEQLLKEALALSPDGIDSNYFYGEFLSRRGRYAESANVLRKVLAIAPRAEHKVADEGRHKDAEELLTKVQAELAKS